MTLMLSQDRLEGNVMEQKIIIFCVNSYVCNQHIFPEALSKIMKKEELALNSHLKLANLPLRLEID